MLVGVSWEASREPFGVNFNASWGSSGCLVGSLGKLPESFLEAILMPRGARQGPLAACRGFFWASGGLLGASRVLRGGSRFLQSFETSGWKF